jgi:hypothetical protein
LVALVFLLRDREGGSERPVVPLRVDDDGSSDLPRRNSPSDPRLPDAALQVPLPETYLTEAFDARPAIATLHPVLIDAPAEPESAPLPVMSTASSALGDAAAAAGLLLLALGRVRRDGRGPLRESSRETRPLTGAISPQP